MARTHGWQGSPPATDEDAIGRILAATRRCIERDGERATVSDVATELGVTRQTVYRYFESTEALLQATALQASGPFVDRLARHVRTIADPAEAVVEALALTIEELPNERYIGVLLRTGPRGAFASSISTENARELGRVIVGRVSEQWTDAGVEQTRVDELVEWQLRILQSMVLDPGTPPRRPKELRAYLRRWLLPAIDDAMRPEPRRADRS